MYLLFVTLVFSLALGPDIKFLKAQEAATELMSMMSTHSTLRSQVKESSPGENTPTEPEETTMRSKDPSTERLITEVGSVVQSEENTMKTELLTIPELLTTAEPTELSTSDAPPETTSQPKQETTMTNVTTAEPPQTPSPSPTIPDPTTVNTEPPVSKPKPALYEITNTFQTSTLLPTPTPITTTILTTTQEQTTTLPEVETTTHPDVQTTTHPDVQTTTHPDVQTTTLPDVQTTTLPEEMIITNNSAGVGVADPGSIAGTGDKKGANWLFIGVIALVIFCILTTLCVITVIMKRRKRSGKQYFGHMNGQRSKKKKVTEDDVWAGPVKLGGGDGEGPEDGNAEGEEKKTDEEEVKGLSTFVTVEENGGVGRPGSPEVEKWEEKEPLLFIDEEGKQKGKRKSEDADAKEGEGKSDTKEAEPNGGETFCLTTAV